MTEDTNKEVDPRLKEYADKMEELFGNDRAVLGDQMSSNHWVVHGDHTETGMPLFAADPHLSNILPSTWLLFHLEYPDGSILSGSNFAGTPGISLGRSNNITVAVTTSRCDTADLW